MISSHWRVPASIAAAVAVVLLVLGIFVHQRRSEESTVALSAEPKAVTVAAARATTFRDERRYVGTFEPWLEAQLGPQLVSAYVASVLVRPGDVVSRGDVVATLDCRDAGAASRAVAEQARALEAKQRAASAEAERLKSLLSGGFVSPNEVEQRTAESDAAASQLAALRSQAAAKELGVNDCVQRAPFAGEIAGRHADPGTFVRPGQAVVTLVDRSTLRLTLYVPERDFAAVAPGTPVHVHALANDAVFDATITRRAPAALATTRNLRVEIDLADKDRTLPAGTTAEVRVEVGEPRRVIEIPVTSARVRGDVATVMVVESDVARRIQAHVVGERGGRLYIDGIEADSSVVVQGRALLRDGDRVLAKNAGTAAAAQ